MSQRLADWTHATVDEECRPAYRAWEAAHRARYHEVLVRRGVALTGDWVVEDLGDLLPAELADRFDDLVPGHEWQVHSRSATSSQALAVGFFGSAILEREPAWRVLASALVPQGTDPGNVVARPAFAHADLLIETDAMVVAVECKRFEHGVGRCSCRRPDPDGDGRATLPAWPVAACRSDVLARAGYWRVARERFGLPEREPGAPCPIALAYQAIRGVAALDALRGDRRGMLVLVHDADNPYFHATGAWPGWPAMLEAVLAGSRDAGIGFHSVTWPQLVPRLLSSPRLVEWARDLHGIESAAAG
jgi:hypothetical protein